MVIRIEHSDHNTKEFGYGLYINGVTDFPQGYPNTVLASECLQRDADDEQIRQAERRVRAKALREYHALC